VSEVPISPAPLELPAASDSSSLDTLSPKLARLLDDSGYQWPSNPLPPQRADPAPLSNQRCSIDPGAGKGFRGHLHQKTLSSDTINVVALLRHVSLPQCAATHYSARTARRDSVERGAARSKLAAVLSAVTSAMTLRRPAHRVNTLEKLAQWCTGGGGGGARVPDLEGRTLALSVQAPTELRIGGGDISIYNGTLQLPGDFTLLLTGGAITLVDLEIKGAAARAALVFSAPPLAAHAQNACRRGDDQLCGPVRGHLHSRARRRHDSDPRGRQPGGVPLARH